MLERLRDFIVKHFPLWRRIELWAWNLPPLWAGIVTALGHTALTAASGPLAPLTATLYTIREIKSAEKLRSPLAIRPPLWDSVSDVVGPWVVVALYAFLAGRLL